MNKALKALKAAYEKDPTDETCSAYVAALSRAFSIGEISYDEAVQAGIEGLRTAGASETRIGHIVNFAKHVPGAEPEDIAHISGFMERMGVKPGDRDGMKRVLGEMESQLPDGIPALVKALGKALPDLPPQVACQIVRELHDAGVTAEQIDSGDVLSQDAEGGIFRLTLKGDSIGPTVGTA